MRRMVIALAVAVSVGTMGTAHADPGEPTQRVVRNRVCRTHQLPNGATLEIECDGVQHQVDGVTSLVQGVRVGVEGEACKTHELPNGATLEIECDGVQHQVDGVTSLVAGVTHEAACGEEGADLDCEGYANDAARVERDAAKASDRALKDAGV